MDHSAEFRRCLEECDVPAVRKLWLHVSPHLPQPANDHEALATLHRARTEIQSMRFRLRAYSHRWLLDNDYPSALPDELRPRAERIYPQVVDGVGIAVKTASRLMSPAIPIIRGAMSDAVSDAYAEGRTDPSFVKARIMEARAKVVSKLFGLPAVLLMALVGASSALQAQCQTIILGEQNTLGFSDSGNAGLLLSQGPYQLSQAATIQTLSFYIANATGQLRLGIYDSGPNHDCKGGALKAQTNAFSPVSNTWNTAPVVTQVQLPVGSYCLAYEPSSSGLSFRKGLTSGQSITDYARKFGTLPATFSASPSTDPNHWMFYATLTGQAPTLSLSFNPPAPSIPANAPAGAIVAQVVAAWSDGSPFTGTMAFSSPYFSDGGAFAFDANFNVVVVADLSGDANTMQNVTVTATQ